MKTGVITGKILVCRSTTRPAQGGSGQAGAQFCLWVTMLALALVFGSPSFSQQATRSADDYQRMLNVTACGYGLGPCNPALLSAAEAVQVTATRHRQNVTACGYGIGQCSVELLSPVEAAQVRAIRHRVNVQACGYGIGQCDATLLTPAEAAQVSAIRHRMNVQACGYGIGRCDKGSLSTAEAVQVTAIRQRQRIAACRYGIGLCNQSKSTSAESEAAYSAWTPESPLASPYGPPSLPEISIQASPSFDAELNVVLNALLPSLGAPVAENGTYYGELNKNGVPKTVLVNGYTRSDGTYVRGYYRSAPGTNPFR